MRFPDIRPLIIPALTIMAKPLMAAAIAIQVRAATRSRSTIQPSTAAKNGAELKTNSALATVVCNRANTFSPLTAEEAEAPLRKREKTL